MKHGTRFGIILLGCAVAVLAACSEPGPSPAEQVAAALRDANLGNVRVESDRGNIRLKGVVASEADVKRAVLIAARAAGRADVSNELTTKEAEGAKAAAISDQRLQKDVQDLVDRDRMVGRRGVKVEVTSGVVELTGSFASMAEKARATDLARSILGVMDATNLLTVKRPTPSRRSPAGRT